MMMQILEAAGVTAITDHVRSADHDNANGYYEHEMVKALAKGRYDWLENAEGKAIKVISALLKQLPVNRHYKVVFMRRELGDVLASQARMLKNMGQTNQAENDVKLKELYRKHLITTAKWLSNCEYMDELYIDYDKTLSDTHSQLVSLLTFLDIKANPDKLVAVVDQNMRHHNLVQSSIVNRTLAD